MSPARRFNPFRDLSRPLRIVLLLAVLIGLAERIGWAMTRRTPYAVGEAANVAIALADGRGFADGFFAGQGPTAHLLPASPAIAGAAYWLLGARTTPAELVLLAWSLVLTFGCYALAATAFALLGVAKRACTWAFVALAVLPIYTTAEAFEWRVWEGGLGLLLALATLVVLLRAERGVAPRGFAWLQAVLPAATFFVLPVLGVAAFAAWALFVWRHRAAGGLVRPALAATLALAAFVAPWTARNALAMGQPILLRDNLGMEIAVANHEAAVAPVDDGRTFLDRLEAIQPYIHPPAQRAMIAAGGEIAYSRGLGAGAATWMRANPAKVAILWGRHFREMLFTRKWLFKTKHGQMLPMVRATIVAIVAVLGLIGLGSGLARRDPLWLYPAAYLWVPVLLYVPFQPVLRYSWLIWPTLVGLAAATLAEAFRGRATAAT